MKKVFLLLFALILFSSIVLAQEPSTEETIWNIIQSNYASSSYGVFKQGITYPLSSPVPINRDDYAELYFIISPKTFDLIKMHEIQFSLTDSQGKDFSDYLKMDSFLPIPYSFSLRHTFIKGTIPKGNYLFKLTPTNSNNIFLKEEGFTQTVSVVYDGTNVVSLLGEDLEEETETINVFVELPDSFDSDNLNDIVLAYNTAKELDIVVDSQGIPVASQQSLTIVIHNQGIDYSGKSFSIPITFPKESNYNPEKVVSYIDPETGKRISLPNGLNKLPQGTYEKTVVDSQSIVPVEDMLEVEIKLGKNYDTVSPYVEGIEVVESSAFRSAEFASKKEEKYLFSANNGVDAVIIPNKEEKAAKIYLFGEDPKTKKYNLIFNYNNLDSAVENYSHNSWDYLNYPFDVPGAAPVSEDNSIINLNDLNLEPKSDAQKVLDNIAFLDKRVDLLEAFWFFQGDPIEVTIFFENYDNSERGLFSIAIKGNAVKPSTTKENSLEDFPFKDGFPTFDLSELSQGVSFSINSFYTNEDLKIYIKNWDNAALDFYVCQDKDNDMKCDVEPVYLEIAKDVTKPVTKIENLQIASVCGEECHTANEIVKPENTPYHIVYLPLTEEFGQDIGINLSDYVKGKPASFLIGKKGITPPSTTKPNNFPAVDGSLVQKKSGVIEVNSINEIETTGVRFDVDSYQGEKIVLIGAWKGDPIEFYVCQDKDDNGKCDLKGYSGDTPVGGASFIEPNLEAASITIDSKTVPSLPAKVVYKNLEVYSVNGLQCWEDGVLCEFDQESAVWKFYLPEGFNEIEFALTNYKETKTSFFIAKEGATVPTSTVFWNYPLFETVDDVTKPENDDDCIEVSLIENPLLAKFSVESYKGENIKLNDWDGTPILFYVCQDKDDNGKCDMYYIGETKSSGAGLKEPNFEFASIRVEEKEISGEEFVGTIELPEDYYCCPPLCPLRDIPMQECGLIPVEDEIIEELKDEFEEIICDEDDDDIVVCTVIIGENNTITYNILIDKDVEIILGDKIIVEGNAYFYEFTPDQEIISLIEGEIPEPIELTVEVTEIDWERFGKKSSSCETAMENAYKYHDLIEKYSEGSEGIGINPNLLRGIIRTENGEFDPDNEHPDGEGKAYGLMQINTINMKDLFGSNWEEEEIWKNPEDNIKAGTTFLQEKEIEINNLDCGKEVYNKIFPNSGIAKATWKEALMVGAYNAGFGNISCDEINNGKGDFTRSTHVPRVMAWYRTYAENYEDYYNYKKHGTPLPNDYCKPTKSTGKSIQPTIKYCDDCSSIMECLACMDHRLVVGISK